MESNIRNNHGYLIMVVILHKYQLTVSVIQPGDVYTYPHSCYPSAIIPCSALRFLLKETRYGD